MPVSGRQPQKRRTCCSIDWQLRELAGRLEMVPPKDDSHRPVDLPPFLTALVSDQSTRTRGRRGCQGRTPECWGRGQFPFLTPDGGHHRRSNYARHVYQPVADGRYPGGTRQAGKRVLVETTMWPGAPIPPWPDAVAGQPFLPPRGRGIRVVDEDASPAVWLPLDE